MTTFKQFLNSKGYGFVPLTLTATNHFEINAKINGISGRFILDTGASNTCLGLDKAAVFKVSAKPSEVRAAGAGATELFTMMATNNVIEIGDWKRQRKRLVLLDLVHVNQALVDHNAQAVDGIIGADILKSGKAIIDYDKKRLFLKRN